MNLLWFSTLTTMVQFPDKSARLDLEDCLLRIADGDVSAVGELYERTKGAVYGFSLSILKNAQDAEDVLQETYVRIFERSDSYRPTGNPMPWILQIAKNLSLMRLRLKQRQTPFEHGEEEMLPDRLTLPEDRMVLRAALEELGEEERQILTLHALAGFKHREIAVFMKKPLSTVLSKYQRAIKKLKNRLEEEGA